MEAELRQFIRSCGDLEVTMENVRQAGFKTHEGSHLFMEKRRNLTTHFLQLTRDFKKALLAASEKQPTLAQTVRFFVNDSEETAKKLNQFFIKFPLHENSLEYASEYGKIFALLLHSVHKHNAVAGLLIHTFAELNPQSKAV